MRRLVLVLALSLLLVGCGKSDKEKNEEAKANTPCPAAPAALTGASGLPSQFPVPDGVVATETKAAGPSTVVTGYAEQDLGEVFDAFKKALAEDPYSVTKSERDAHDAEVNFAGESTTGQVRLGEACTGRTSVQITARPQ
jgi:major membrane immunogen (membrane-anchored lipoprotein)